MYKGIIHIYALISHENDDAMYTLYHYCNCSHSILLFIVILQRCICVTISRTCRRDFYSTLFVLDSRRMCQFVSYTAHLCISGAKLYYLNYFYLLLFLNDFCFVLLQVLPDIHHNI